MIKNDDHDLTMSISTLSNDRFQKWGFNYDLTMIELWAFNYD